MADQPDEPMDLTAVPLPSKSNVLTEALDAAATTSETPFAEPRKIAAQKTKAQKRREYRRRLAASRTPAQVMAARKSDAERQRICRLRKAAYSALASGSFESTTAFSSRSGARSSYNHTMTDQPDEPMDLTGLSLPSKSNVLTEALDTASTSAMPFAKPRKIAALKSKAQRQREYRQRIAASRTPAQAIAARKSDAERQRICRLRKSAYFNCSLKM